MFGESRRKIQYRGRKRRDYPKNDIRDVSVQTIIIIGLALWVAFLLFFGTPSPKVDSATVHEPGSKLRGFDAEQLVQNNRQMVNLDGRDAHDGNDDGDDGGDEGDEGDDGDDSVDDANSSTNSVEGHFDNHLNADLDSVSARLENPNGDNSVDNNSVDDDSVDDADNSNELTAGNSNQMLRLEVENDGDDDENEIDDVQKDSADDKDDIQPNDMRDNKFDDKIPPPFDFKKFPPPDLEESADDGEAEETDNDEYENKDDDEEEILELDQKLESDMDLRLQAHREEMEGTMEEEAETLETLKNKLADVEKILQSIQEKEEQLDRKILQADNNENLKIEQVIEKVPEQLETPPYKDNEQQVEQPLQQLENPQIQDKKQGLEESLEHHEIAPNQENEQHLEEQSQQHEKPLFPENDEQVEEKSEKVENILSSDVERDTFYDFSDTSISLPFPIDDDPSSNFALSTWIYLSTSSHDDPQSRYILTTKKFGCVKETNDNQGGIALYINKHSTENQALTLEYVTAEGCQITESLGFVFPFQKWTHVGVSYTGDSLILFMNGESIVEENVKNIISSNESVTKIGEMLEGGGFLEGSIASLKIWKSTVIDEEKMLEIYNEGIGTEKIGNQSGQGDVNVSPTYLYPFAAHDPLREEIESKNASMNTIESPPIHEEENVRIAIGEGLRSAHIDPDWRPLEPGAIGEGLRSAHIDPDWRPLGPGRYSEYKDGTNVFVSTPEILEKSDTVARFRRTAVKNAMKHAWNGYKEYAWGFDELLPQSGASQNVWGGLGTTLVDSLDTLWLMDMKEEFWEARDWVRDHLNHDIPRWVSVFETTIRSLGGLLSAYDWSGDEVFLEKAKDLGDRLFKAFQSRSGLPYGQVNLYDGRASTAKWLRGNLITSEIASLQVEFRYLSKVTGNPEYAIKSEAVFKKLNRVQPANGLYAFRLKENGEFANDVITFGANCDSFYEYMLKIWLQGGKKEKIYRAMYDKAMDGMHKKLLRKNPDGLTYIAEVHHGKLKGKFDHLVCFMAGNLALGAYTHPGGLDSPKAQRDLKTGKALAYTCYQLYASTKTGIAPEIARFEGKMMPDVMSTHYLLRPEAVESFFILNQLTGDPIYREWGWEVFQAIERYCKTKYGYGGRKDVNRPNEIPTDKMESFFTGETLKYLYLLYDPDTEIDILNKHVFNTEAHPTKMFDVMDVEKE